MKIFNNIPKNWYFRPFCYVHIYFQEFEKRRETRWGDHAQDDDEDEEEKESGENDPEERDSEGEGSQSRVSSNVERLIITLSQTQSKITRCL